VQFENPALKEVWLCSYRHKAPLVECTHMFRCDAAEAQNRRITYR